MNDRNTDRAAGYTVWGSSLRWSRQWQKWSAQTFVRLDNLFDRRYAGSVIVNEGNQRFFEPGAGRGLSAHMAGIWPPTTSCTAGAAPR